MGETFRYYSSGRASPTLSRAEFNFRPEMDDSVRYVSLMGGDRMLDITESRSEREYEVSLLPDQAALLKSFGVAPDRRPRPWGTHPLDTLERTPLQLFVRNLAIAATVACLLVGWIMTSKGTTIVATPSQSIDSEMKLPFEVTNSAGLTEIEIWPTRIIHGPGSRPKLTDAEDEPVAAFERGVEYYRGGDWSEGSQRARTRLKLEPGTYTLYLGKTGAEVDWTGGRLASSFKATVRQGVATSFWMWSLALVFGLVAFYFLGQRFWRYNQRWSGSDWSDD